MFLEDLFRRGTTLARFRLPPLGPKMDEFSEWLRAQRFSRHVMRRRIWQVSHFNQYLRRQGVRACQEVEKSHGERFIIRHLPRCCCGGRRGIKHVGASSSVRSFIDFLSERGLVSVASPSPPSYQKLLQEYLDYLKSERNLAERTLKAHREGSTALLEHLGAPVAERLAKLSPEQVLAFFIDCTRDAGTARRRLLQGVLRCFLRFGFQKGYLERDLSEALPPIRTYKLSGLPRGISEEDAQKTLKHIDRTTPAGRRDFAIIQLLHTYGVRGGQLRALRLEDIRWRENSIRFAAYKGGKEVIEPLTDEVGKSLFDYLRHARPQAPDPEVFLKLRAPHGPMRQPSAISMIVRERMRQAAVSPPKGTHAFRHGFATRMLQHGQSLKTIADLLGHRNLNTTFIYTKLDLETLKQVALEWPEFDQ